ncbi:MAG: sulfotransferase domain-containing protein [Chloroflexi bacterium]|nr:sulfotransferase domain-containing protein [Chloroflexota bacterium]
MVFRNSRCPNKPWDPNLIRSEIRRSLRYSLEWVYRRLTARWRGLPQVYIAGVKRAGTSSLFRYLMEHPRARYPFRQRKEIKFYIYMYDLGPSWYRAYFPFQRELQTHFTVDATPSYLMSPLFPERFMTLTPHAKIILLLRNPVQRTLSHYFHNRRRGLEPLSLEEALQAEEQRLAGEQERMLRDPCYVPWRYHRLGYLTESRYVEHLRRLWKHVPREQTLVLRSEDFFEQPQRLLDQIADFLNIEPWQPNLKVYNQGQYDQPVPQRVRAQLQAYFRPYNQALYELLGRDLGWN